MRSREQIIQSETDRLKKLLNREKFIYEPNMTEELLFDIRDQLKRIADSLEGDKVNVTYKYNSTHLQRILDDPAYEKPLEVDMHQGRITNYYPKKRK